MSMPVITYTASTSGWTTGPLHTGEKPKDPPQTLFSTRGQQTKAGWIGQVIVDREIVFETEPYEDAADAMREVNAYVIGRVKRLLAPEVSA